MHNSGKEFHETVHSHIPCHSDPFHQQENQVMTSQPAMDLVPQLEVVHFKAQRPTCTVLPRHTVSPPSHLLIG